MQDAVTQAHQATLAPVSACGKATTVPVSHVSGEEGDLQSLLSFLFDLVYQSSVMYRCTSPSSSLLSLLSEPDWNAVRTLCSVQTRSCPTRALEAAA